jgi:hypothetical protein
MSTDEQDATSSPASAPDTRPPADPSNPPILSKLEQVLGHPPILDSLFAQITTEDAFHLYHTNKYLRNYLRSLPTAWRYISWRLYQPAVPVPANNANNLKQVGNYSLDQLLINVINPYSTRLQSLELDNTAVSGGTLTQTVLILRRETLQHLSVRGCKNVSLKYHINPWLQMHALANQGQGKEGPFPYDKLALKSLYTYRCRHHRRRPYLPSSLTRKESDSEPTHELVKTCHKLNIWTDTAWCTTPGSRCFRRRGYVTMRSPQDPREVWVVFDRLWRSKNWLGPADSANPSSANSSRRKSDARFWITKEKARQGESLNVAGEGKNVPMHLRKSHRRFIEDIICNNCGDAIHERCEQCSVMMHCSGCRKTLCGSCAFDRPYLRNKNAPESDRNKYWWAPGCAVSPCAMQDQDVPPPPGPANGPNGPSSTLPNIRTKWCCTEPVFSGGGGITFPSGSNRDSESLRAAPLPKGEGWEDPDFIEPDQSDDEATVKAESASETTEIDTGKQMLAGRWKSLSDFFARNFDRHESIPSANHATVPRVLCDECHTSDMWRVTCKGCSLPLCIKHDMREKLKVRICGHRDLAHEMREYSLQKKKWEQKWERITEQLKLLDPAHSSPQDPANASSGAVAAPVLSAILSPGQVISILGQSEHSTFEAAVHPQGSSESVNRPITLAGPTSAPVQEMDTAVRPQNPGPSSSVLSRLAAPMVRSSTPNPELEVPPRPPSRGSCTDSASRSSSPAPSASTIPATPEPKSAQKKVARKPAIAPRQPSWKGCTSFFCPAIRPAGDHRRRCPALMRQCSECKVNVCSECVANIDPPCPCRGCQVPPSDENNMATSNDSPLFFCPNCRWSRMATGKCKKFTEAFLAAQVAESGRSRRHKKLKTRKPLEARRPSNSMAVTSDEAAEFLSEFADMRLEDLVVDGVPSDTQTVREDEGEIREIEDVGVLARELIARIQALRGQFRPGSQHALALPDVRLVDDTQSIVVSQPTESDASNDTV